MQVNQVSGFITDANSDIVYIFLSASPKQQQQQQQQNFGLKHVLFKKRKHSKLENTVRTSNTPSFSINKCYFCPIAH